MNYYVNDIEFDFDDDEANTICNSDPDAPGSGPLSPQAKEPPVAARQNTRP